MPLPNDFPDWLYPGTVLVRRIDDTSWRITSLLYEAHTYWAILSNVEWAPTNETTYRLHAPTVLRDFAPPTEPLYSLLTMQHSGVEALVFLLRETDTHLHVQFVGGNVEAIPIEQTSIATFHATVSVLVTAPYQDRVYNVGDLFRGEEGDYYGVVEVADEPTEEGPRQRITIATDVLRGDYNSDLHQSYFIDNLREGLGYPPPPPEGDLTEVPFTRVPLNGFKINEEAVQAQPVVRRSVFDRLNEEDEL